MYKHETERGSCPDSNILSEQRSSCHQSTSSKLDWILEIEKVATFTLNAHYLEDYRSKFEAKYKALRHEKSAYANAIRILTHSAPPEPTIEIEEEYDLRMSTPSSVGLRSPVRRFQSPDSDHVTEVTYPVIMEAGDLPTYPADPVQVQRDRLLGAIRSFGLPAAVEDVLKLLPTDPSDRAVLIMADVRAYWQGANHDMIYGGMHMK